MTSTAKISWASERNLVTLPPSPVSRLYSPSRQMPWWDCWATALTKASWDLGLPPAQLSPLWWRAGVAETWWRRNLIRWVTRGPFPPSKLHTSLSFANPVPFLSQVCQWVLKCRNSKNSLIQMTILNLLPRLAAFRPSAFTGEDVCGRRHYPLTGN